MDIDTTNAHTFIASARSFVEAAGSFVSACDSVGRRTDPHVTFDTPDGVLTIHVTDTADGVEFVGVNKATRKAEVTTLNRTEAAQSVQGIVRLFR